MKPVFNEHLVPKEITDTVKAIYDLESRLTRGDWDAKINKLCLGLEQIGDPDKIVVAHDVIVAALGNAHQTCKGLRSPALSYAKLRLATIVAACQAAENIEAFSRDPRLSALCSPAPLQALWKP